MEGLREFEFHERLGRGGFGEVYRATLRDGVREVEVAVKLLHHAVGRQHQAVERLRDEARILGMVAHPGVPSPHGVTFLDNRVALVVEYVAGIDLQDLGLLPHGPALRVIERVASALHSANVTVIDGAPIKVVHRDVKPSNIRLAYDGRVKLLDFGIARMDARDRETDTDHEEVLGSIPYLAPERLLEGCSEPPQDVFALGSTLFESLTGKTLFHRTLTQTYVVLAEPENFDAHLDERFADAALPASIEALLRRMLTYRARDRPDAHAVSCEAHRLAAERKDTDLEAFMRTKPRRALEAGALSGKVLREVRRATLVTDPDGSGQPATVLWGADNPRPRTDEAPLPPRVPPMAPVVPKRARGRPLVRFAGLVLFLAFLAIVGSVVFGIVFAVA